MRSPRELAHARGFANHFADCFLRDRYITLELRLVTPLDVSTRQLCDESFVGLAPLVGLHAAFRAVPDICTAAVSLPRVFPAQFGAVSHPQAAPGGWVSFAALVTQ